jgi:hypothetical protein
MEIIRQTFFPRRTKSRRTEFATTNSLVLLSSALSGYYKQTTTATSFDKAFSVYQSKQINMVG